MKVFVLLVLVAAFPGCSFLSSYIELHVQVEPFPGFLPAGVPEQFEFLLPDEDGQILSGSSISLSIGKSANVPVLARIPGTGVCAAGFFPSDFHKGVLKLSWEQGALGVVLRSLYRNGLPVEQLDVRALQDRFLKAGEGNPWLCNTGEIALVLAYTGVLPSYPPLVETRVVFFPEETPLSGVPPVLFPANPFGPGIDIRSGQAELPMGLSWYFDREGAACVMSLDREGWRCFSGTSGWRVSGCW